MSIGLKTWLPGLILALVNLLLPNYLADFQIILQKCSLGDTLQLSFKPWWLVKKHGHHWAVWRFNLCLMAVERYWPSCRFLGKLPLLLVHLLRHRPICRNAKSTVLTRRERHYMLRAWRETVVTSNLFWKPCFRGNFDPFVNNGNLGAIAQNEQWHLNFNCLPRKMI